MADANATCGSGPERLANAMPSLDAVLLWVTPVVERDYAARGVFPNIRSDRATHARANATLHPLTRPDAQVVLADAEGRLARATKGAQVAYKAHAENLREAIKEAKSRRSEFEAADPVCTDKSPWSETWQGTKKQLQAMGIGIAFALPGEPGGNPRTASTRDRRGYAVRIKRASTVWTDFYEAYISIPETPRTPVDATKSERRGAVDDLIIARLKAMPATPEKFKGDVATNFSIHIATTARAMRGEGGFRFTDEAIDKFVQAAIVAMSALHNGDTEGLAPLETMRGVLCARAKDDEPLQRFLASLDVDPKATRAAN